MADVVDALNLTNSLLAGSICFIGSIVGSILGLIFFSRFTR